MIRMSKAADYGFVLLTEFLAESGRDSLSARELAQRTQLSLPMVSKILKILTREGLLVSQRGANGGYKLSRDPKCITVGEVVSAMEGPLAMTECLDSQGDCQQEAFCPVRTNWARINYAVQNVLDAISIRDMLTPLPEELVTLSGVPVSTVERSAKAEMAGQPR
jgi:FeS assembly SUF system regulator